MRFASNNGGVIDPTIGPKRSPLGFSADPGGLPLYKNGTLVGEIGVIADGVYGLVRNKNADGGLDESIALKPPPVSARQRRSGPIASSSTVAG